jgi:hypothetical protein
MVRVNAAVASFISTRPMYVSACLAVATSGSPMALISTPAIRSDWSQGL